MTTEILFVFGILAASFGLALYGRARMDLVAMFVLGTLAASRILSPAEALAGFSNQATVTIWAMFILSGALDRTGVAGIVARQLLRGPARSEKGAIALVMIAACILSAFMNNVAVVAFMLPVVMDVSRRTGHAPSRLLMPLTVGAFLGGTSTLIGTSPNLVASIAMVDAGFEPLSMFAFTPVGVAIAVAGIVFMVLAGPRLLPSRNPVTESGLHAGSRTRAMNDLSERLFLLRVPDPSVLAGRSLAESRLGAILGLNVVAILRNDSTILAPGPDHTLVQGDRLLAGGRLDGLSELGDWRPFDLEDQRLDLESLISAEIGFAELRVSDSSSCIGESILDLDFRRKHSVNVLAIRRAERLWRTNLHLLLLQAGDRLLVQGDLRQIAGLGESRDFDSTRSLSRSQVSEEYELEARLFVVTVPNGSHLAGHSLAESRLGGAFGLLVLGILRDFETRLMPDPDDPVRVGDRLLVSARSSDLQIIQGLQQLTVESGAEASLADLESEQIGLLEVVLSPYSALAGRTLRQIHFREKYGLSVLAILRGSEVLRANLRDVPLRYGDALLLHGKRDELQVLGGEPDFLSLSKAIQQPPRSEKSGLASLIMVSTVLATLTGIAPVAIASVIGASLMIASGCLTMDEAYRTISWRAVFLIAGMLPLGSALAKTGAASLVATKLSELPALGGTMGVLAALFVISFLLAQVVPPAATVALMVPVALSLASSLALSPQMLVLITAYAVSVGFLTPVTQPGNVMILGPGGYEGRDYVRIGLPLTILTMLIVVPLLALMYGH